MATNDKPNIDLVLSDLEKEIQAPEPFTLVLRNNVRVTFKDPMDFKMSERHDIIGDYGAAQRGEIDDYDFLKRIMTEADFEKYKKADLHIRTHNAVLQRVMNHFQGALGE